MKKLFLYIVSLFILVGCSDEIPEHEPPLQAKRTILAYLIANNNLDSAIMNNVVWMYQSLATSKDSCSLILYYKPSSSNTDIDEAQILAFFADGNGQINGQPVLEESAMTESNVIAQANKYAAVTGVATDPDVMRANLQIMTDILPSESYGLIFGSHATSWMPAVGTDIPTKSFGWDGVERNSINIPEFADVLEDCFHGDLDYILFDACMMQTAEVCYEMRNVTRYCIASVMETPLIGYPYHLILNNLYQDEIDFQKLCDDIIRFNKEERLWGTYAVVDCLQMDLFANAVREQISQHRADLESMQDFHLFQQYGVNSFIYFSFDIADVIKQLNDGELPASFQQILDQTVIAKSCITDASSYTAGNYASVLRDEDRYCGLGMYIPGAVDNSDWNAYYRSDISWYQAVWN